MQGRTELCSAIDMQIFIKQRALWMGFQCNKDIEETKDSLEGWTGEDVGSISTEMLDTYPTNYKLWSLEARLEVIIKVKKRNKEKVLFSMPFFRTTTQTHTTNVDSSLSAAFDVGKISITVTPSTNPHRRWKIRWRCPCYYDLPSLAYFFREQWIRIQIDGENVNVEEQWKFNYHNMNLMRKFPV